MLARPAQGQPMSRTLRQQQWQIAREWMRLWFAVPQVVALRGARMSMSLRDRAERQRMGREKVDAFAGSWQAMGMQALDAQWRFASALMGLWNPAAWSTPARALRETGLAGERMQSAALQGLSKGVAPVRRRAVANAKRLARQR